MLVIDAEGQARATHNAVTALLRPRPALPQPIHAFDGYVGSYMTDIEIAGAVRAAIGEVLDIDPAQLRDEQVLAVDLEVDSLAATELALVIEDEFGIRVPQDERDEIVTVGDVIAVVQMKRRVMEAQALGG